MTACIYFDPEGYSTSGPRLMGRNAAGESFLRGFIRHSVTEKFWAQVRHAEHGELFKSEIRSHERNESIGIVDYNSFSKLSEPGTLYFPGPNIGNFAFHRGTFGHGSWSLCGITHTTSSASSMDSISELLTAPVQAWDALICTSTAVKSNVNRILQAQVDYLKDRLGVTRLVLPQLPVIPLGINTDDFLYTDAQKAAARFDLNIAAESLVVVYMGRLSFHAKAHPLAMYQALERASQSSNKTIVLIECGWHANDSIAKAFADAARLACPSVRVINLDGREAKLRNQAWSSADVFCSLSDNIQETFGIVPIEAMAAGLPVVVSDWDGYKDTVRDGIDGFRISTLMPKPGLGADLAQRHARGIDNYDMYCGQSSSLISVNVDSAAEAFQRLFSSIDLRRKFGEAGRIRAQQIYDWKNIIPKYEELWSELSSIRIRESKSIQLSAHPWPARMDPFESFAGYPTFTLSPKSRLSLAVRNKDAAINLLKNYFKLDMVNYSKYVIPNDDEIHAILNNASGVIRTAEELVSGIASEREPYAIRGLAWLLKLGILKHHP